MDTSYTSPAPPVDYLTPLKDVDVPAEHQSTLNKYRSLATSWGVAPDVAVCYRVRAGFTLKHHVPTSGSSREDFSHLQEWNCLDEPTKDSFVFWIPRIVPDSNAQPKDALMRLLGEIRTLNKLPTHHLRNFGNVDLLAGLIIVHYKATNERVPPERLWAYTDTCAPAFGRLYLSFSVKVGLVCGYYQGLVDYQPNDEVTAFALGVETLGR